MRNSLLALKHTHACLLIASGMVGSVTAQAQTGSGFYALPSITILEGHDDNLFFTIADEREDWFTRVSPALEAGYQSEPLNYSARYSIDAEDYRENNELDSWLNRRFGEARFDWQPNARLNLMAEASYTKTNTPIDLTLNTASVVQGFLVGRTEAERTIVHPSVSYRLTTDTEAELGFTQTDDKLSGDIESETKVAEVEFETQLSAANALNYGYLYRDYSFTIPAEQQPGSEFESPEDNRDSHTPWVGITHDFNARTTIIARGGPRYSGSSVDPFILLALQRQNANGQIEVSYEQNETTLLGELGRVDSETLMGSWIQQFGTRTEIEVVPSYSQVSQTLFEVDIFHLGMLASYRINNILSLTASYDLNLQDVDYEDGRQDEINRNLVMLGFTLSWPRRDQEEERER